MNRIKTYFHLLFLPEDQSNDVAIRLKSNILAGLLVFFIIIFGTLDTYNATVYSDYKIPWIGYVFLFTSLILNRISMYSVAAFVAAAMFPTVIFSEVISATGAGVFVSLNYLVLGLIFGSILMGFRSTIVLVIVQMAGIACLPLVNPIAFPSYKSILAILTVNFLSASLLLYFMYLRNRIEKIRSQELIQSYSKLKTTQEDLRHQEIFQERVLHTSPLITGVLDLQELRFVYLSRSFMQHLRFRDVKTDELSSDFLQNYLHPDDVKNVVALAEKWKLGTDKDLMRMELRFLDSEKKWRTFDITHSPFSRDEKGQVEQVICSSLDVTDQKLLEERLNHAQKMETLGHLAGGVAHDFANLLTPILGYSELMLLGRKQSDSDYGDIKSIHDAGTKAKHLIQQLLSFGRKQIMEVTDLKPNEVIQNFAKILRRTIRENVDIKYRLHPEVSLFRADIFQIEQILMNMAVNAQDAMESGGTLVIETGNAFFDDAYAASNPEASAGRFVCLAISDTGTGIDNETQRRIFEPFFTTKEAGKGTGLGLATVYGIVKQHNGHINVYSEVGKGTTFRMYFPALEGMARNIDNDKDAEVVNGTGKIIVVEDNEMAREMVCRILQQHGFETIDFESPESCLIRFREAPESVRLLLTDIIMPGMNGRELFLELRKLDSMLRVAYMSGYSESIISHQGILESGSILVAKPFTIQSLMTKVHQALAAS